MLSKIGRDYLTSTSVESYRYTNLLDNVIMECSNVLRKTTENLILDCFYCGKYSNSVPTVCASISQEYKRAYHQVRYGTTFNIIYFRWQASG
jgi:hypothetical protein